LLKIGLRSFSPFPMRKTWGLFCTYLHKCYCISTLKCAKKCGYNTFCSFVDIQITDHKNFGVPIVDVTKLCILKWPKLCVLATTYPYEEHLTPAPRGLFRRVRLIILSTFWRTVCYLDVDIEAMLQSEIAASTPSYIHSFNTYIHTYIACIPNGCDTCTRRVSSDSCLRNEGNLNWHVLTYIQCDQKVCTKNISKCPKIARMSLLLLLLLLWIPRELRSRVQVRPHLLGPSPWIPSWGRRTTLHY
jgi:hypothetical protein